MRPITGDLQAMILLSAVLAPVGVWMLVTAWRRRKGVGPHCAACDYSLEGLPESVGQCPECGANLSRKGAVALGRRRRDFGRAVTGIGFLLPAMLVGVLYSGLHLPRRPLLVSTRPSGGMSATIPAPPRPYANLTPDELADAIIADPPEPALSALFDEVGSRIIVSPSLQRPVPWLARLIKAGLERQGDTTRDWPFPWATFMESLQQARILGFEQWRQYLQQGVRVDATFRKTAEIGRPFPFKFATSVRVSPSLCKRLKCRFITLSVGDATSDRVLGNDPQTPDRFTSNSGYPASFDQEQWKKAKPGETTARLMVLVVYTPPYTNSTSDWLIRIERPVTLLAPGSTPKVYSPEIDNAVARSLRVSADPNSTASDGLRFDGRQVKLALTCTDCPIDLYAQVSVGVGSAGHQMGYVTWRKGQSGTQYFTWGKDLFDLAGGRPVDVTVIGTPEAAAITFEEGFEWRGTVKFDKVSIGRGAAPARPLSNIHIYQRGEDPATGAPFKSGPAADDPAAR